MIRKIVFISGALFSSLTLLSVLFKLQHLPGANRMLTVGMGGLALIFIPLCAFYQYRKGR